MRGERGVIVERFELETDDDVVQVGRVVDVPDVGIAVLGLGTNDATIYVDGEIRGQFVDINIDYETFISYVTGEEHPIYGKRHVLGQRVIR